jgi:hypothetical protein
MSFKRKARRLAERRKDDPKTPAPKKDQRTGSKKNPEGSASGTRGSIEVSDRTEKALENLRDEHNEKHEAAGRRVDLGMLKAVYRRGAGAFSTVSLFLRAVSHRPSVSSRDQWALARVKAFLKLVGTGQRKEAYDTDLDLLPKEHPQHRAKETSEKLAELPKKYAHIDFKPSKGAQEAAARALEVRAEKPESQRGMTAVGIARARDLKNGVELSPETVRRMLNYFTRHEVDKKGATWDEQGKGWQAWQGWGGDAGFAWARKVVGQMNAADNKSLTERAFTFSEAEEIDLDGLTVVVEDGQQLGRPFVTLRAGTVASRMSGETIAEVTPAMLAEIVRVYQARKESDPVIIDWNHQSSPSYGSNTPETGGALGEIVDLRLSEDGQCLIAIPAYNERGLKTVAEAQGSLWSSPEFVMGEVYARESGAPTGGAQLLAVTLTPRPQQTASSVDRVLLTEEANLMETRENLLKMEHEDLVDLLLQKMAMVAEMEKDLTEDEKNLAEDEDKKDLAEDEDKKDLAEDEDKEKMMETKSYSMNESSALLLAEVSTLREQLTALREENQSVKRKGAVDELVRSGRISPAEVALAEKAWNQAQSGDEAFWAMFCERKAGSVVSLREVGHGASGEQINRETLAERAKLLASEKSVSFSEALNLIRTTDREFFLAAMEG